MDTTTQLAIKWKRKDIKAKLAELEIKLKLATIKANEDLKKLEDKDEKFILEITEVFIQRWKAADLGLDPNMF